MDSNKTFSLLRNHHQSLPGHVTTIYKQKISVNLLRGRKKTPEYLSYEKIALSMLTQYTRYILLKKNRKQIECEQLNSPVCTWTLARLLHERNDAIYMDDDNFFARYCQIKWNHLKIILGRHSNITMEFILEKIMMLFKSDRVKQGD